MEKCDDTLHGDVKLCLGLITVGEWEYIRSVVPTGSSEKKTPANSGSVVSAHNYITPVIVVSSHCKTSIDLTVRHQWQFMSLQSTCQMSTAMAYSGRIAGL
jgi:hypothetical protein